MKNKKKNIWIGIGVCLLIGLGLSIQKSSFTKSQTVCVDQQCRQLEVAATSSHREQGLMYRTELGPNSGMFFVFPENKKRPFWMKNTKIPLDIIRLDSSHRVRDIQEASPCEQDPCPPYIPNHQARFVIELTQGSAKKYGIRTGMILWEK